MITLYATTRHGEGWVMKLGEYECIDDIVIQAGMFERDVELTFVDDYEEFDEGTDDITTEKETINTKPLVVPTASKEPYDPHRAPLMPTIPVPWTPYDPKFPSTLTSDMGKGK